MSLQIRGKVSNRGGIRGNNSFRGIRCVTNKDGDEMNHTTDMEVELLRNKVAVV